ncbi:hypothetical protein B0H15DRAFT_569586 [Mycena belliarum]|uniref:Uncharacterized protein n=1 Tax=Mycena belliarum TaxID=1033014 RepID=A0AAD6TRR8_9AGAR|nr:hypothetical protein B0H15DRAFT_569586 [Mycena belliae]
MTSSTLTTVTPPSVSVVVHSTESTEDFSTWPPEARGIFRALERPLPSWCAVGAHIEVLPLPVACGVDQQPLAHVFNLVLSTVLDIRSLIAQYGPSRSVLPFLSNLVRILAQMCAEEAITMFDASFVRPRTKTPDLRGFDGLATMLTCHIVDGFGESSIPPLATEAIQSPESPLPSHSTSIDSETVTSSSTTLSTEMEAIDIPLDAHILPGSGIHVSAALPLLCIADEDNMLDLMTSVACQRHVWGIPRPVVGFLHSKTASLAKLVLSWFDPATSTVHIAYDTKSTTGAFDFTDAASALAFAHLILSFSTDFSSILKRARAGCDNNGFDWRSDNRVSQDVECGRNRVAWWVDHVTRSSPKSLSLLLKPPSSQLGPCSLAISEGAMSKSNHQTSSSFAARSISDTENSDTIWWLIDRCVQTIGRIRFVNNPTNEQQEINRQIGLYDEMCGLRTVEDMDTLPSVDEVLAPIRKTLIAQLPSASESSVLTDAHRNILFGRLSALLSVTVGSYTLEAKRRNITVYEAESRHDWDALLYHFYAQGTEIISPYVMLEHTIHYPRNDLFDEIEKESFISGMENQLHLSSVLCVAALQAAVAPGDQPPDGRAKALSAVNQAIEFHSIFTALDPSKVKAMLRTRSDKAPVSGKTDAILVLAIPKPNLRNKSAGIIFDTGLSALQKEAKEASNLKGKHTEFKYAARDSSERGASAPRDTSIASESAARPVSVTATKMTDNDWATLQNPFDSPSVEPDQLAVAVPSFHGHIILPHAVAEYKKGSDNPGKALNQGRMYLTSVISYYAALGIENYPFYGLVTSGTRGAILMGWKSQEQKKIYLMERSIYQYDISSPAQAFQFATFLLRLREDQNKLKDLVEAKLKDNVDVLNSRLERWRKQAQTAESNLARTQSGLVPLEPVAE